MNRISWLPLSLVFLPALALAQLNVEKLSDHAYAAFNDAGWANAGFIVTDEGVLVIDSRDTVVHAEEMIAEIKQKTNAPIVYAVNTNFHYNNVTGNQVLLPTVKAIIAHEETRTLMQQIGQLELDGVKQTYQLAIQSLERILAEDPLTDQEREERQAELADAKKSLFALDRTRLTPPNLTMTDGTLRFYLGGVEIQIVYVGRGYTSGDLVVYLPAEKVVFLGNLLFAQTVPWIEGSYIADWSKTLDAVLKLEFDKVVPGVGDLATRDDIIAFKGYLNDLYTEVKNQYDQGVPKEDVRWKVDLSAYENWASYKDNLRYNIEEAFDEIERMRTSQ